MFLAIGLITIFTLKILDAFVGFIMFPKVADLAERGLTVVVSTLMRFFLCVGHQVTVELCYTVNHFVTFLFADVILIMACKYFVVLL